MYYIVLYHTEFRFVREKLFVLVSFELVDLKINETSDNDSLHGSPAKMPRVDKDSENSGEVVLTPSRRRNNEKSVKDVKELNQSNKLDFLKETHSQDNSSSSKRKTRASMFATSAEIDSRLEKSRTRSTRKSMASITLPEMPPISEATEHDIESDDRRSASNIKNEKLHKSETRRSNRRSAASTARSRSHTDMDVEMSSPAKHSTDKLDVALPSSISKGRKSLRSKRSSAVTAIDVLPASIGCTAVVREDLMEVNLNSAANGNKDDDQTAGLYSPMDVNEADVTARISSEVETIRDCRVNVGNKENIDTLAKMTQSPSKVNEFVVILLNIVIVGLFLVVI